MAHYCKRVQKGHKSCPEHLLTRDGLRYRFRKYMEDVLSLEEMQAWHDIMQASMLQSDKTIPLDDRPQWYIEKIAKGEVAT